MFTQRKPNAVSILWAKGILLGLIAWVNGFTCLAEPVYTWTNFVGQPGGLGNVDGTGSAARFNYPSGVAVDSSGNVYVADSTNHTIRKITSAGVVSTLAGRAGFQGSTDGTGSAARFRNPYGVAVDGSGNVFVADSSNHTIRKITSAGVVSTLAGTPSSSGSTDGTGSAARFSSPSGVAVDGSGNVYVADSRNHTIRKITGAGVVSTLAGLAPFQGTTDGTGSAARFRYPQRVAVDGSGNVFVADAFNHTIRKITSAGLVSTLAGTAGASGSTDGTGSAARFREPSDVAVDGSGNVYVADRSSYTIRKITSAGVVSTLAGTAGSWGSTDGTGSAARFAYPSGVAVDGSGNVFVADAFNHTIRKITSVGVVSTLAGTASYPGSTDGTGSAARFGNPTGVAVDGSGNVYVADYWNNTIRKITSAGAVSTLAGTAGSWGSADGTGSAARFWNPQGVAVDGSGNVYVADSNNHTIRKINNAGVVSTLAGTAGSPGSTDGTGSAARFLNPYGMAVDGSGNVYVADTGNHTIRKISSAGVVNTIGGLAGFSSSDDGIATRSRFSSPIGISVSPSGSLFVADYDNNRISRGSPSFLPIPELAPATDHTPTSVTLNGTVNPNGLATTAFFDYGLTTAYGSSVAVMLSPSDGSEAQSVSAGLTGLTPGTRYHYRLRASNSDGTHHSLSATFTTSSNVSATFSSALDVPVTADSFAASGANFSLTLNFAPALGTVLTVVDNTGTDPVIGHFAGYPAGAQVSATFGGVSYYFVIGYGGGDGNDIVLTRTLAPGQSPTTFSWTNFVGQPGGLGNVDGTGSAARFSYPNGVAVDGSGNVYVADSSNHTIRKITSAGVVNTLAGTAGSPGSTDGTGSAARFTNPSGVAVDGSGNVYVADRGNHTIRKITSAGVVSTLAGKAGASGSTDGTGSAARFRNPYGVAVDGSGNVYVADWENHTIRKITSAGVVSTLAGTVGSQGSTDGTGSAARFRYPYGVVVDGSGNVYVADSNNHTIRKITSAGVVSTIGGLAGNIGSDDGIAALARFDTPTGIALAPSGRLFVAHRSNHRIGAGVPVAFAPVVSLISTTGLSATGATLNGKVNPNGTATTGMFEYGTDESFGSNAAITLSPSDGFGDQNVSATVSGLSPATVYFYRLTATNADGTSNTAGGSFTTLSDNANLSSLTLSSGALSPTFASGTTVYTASVANATTSITVTPTRAQANATIEARVNGGGYSPVTSGSPSGALALNIGANPIEIRVTAQAGNTKTYTVTITRRAPPTVTDPVSSAIGGNGATLGGTVAADGDSPVTERGVVYSVNATNSDPYLDGPGVTKVTTTGTTGAFTVPVTGLGSATVHAYRAYAINSEGVGYTAKATFTTLSANANLSSLSLDAGTLSPAFAAGTTSYTASVANATAAVSVTATRAHGLASLEIRANGAPYEALTSGTPSAPLALNVGSNTINLRVTAQAGNTRTYTITVTRRAPPTVTSPTSTSITATGATLGGNVTADGAAAITERGVVYSVTATNANPLIGGAGVTKVTTTGTTGVFTTPVTGLTQGTAYSFKAYAINSEGTSYTSVATFTTQSTNADLSALTLSSGTLSPTFASGTTSYTASVANATSSITVTPTRAQANATIEARVNGGGYAAVTSGNPSGALALNVGANTIDVRVTAQAGNTRTYTITVTRDKASQTITGFANPGTRLANTTVNLSATGGGSNNPVIFTVEGPAQIDGSNVLSFSGTGSVTVRANQAGNDFYHAAPEVAHTFTVSAAPATVTLDHLTQTYDGTPKTATATTNPPGLSLSIVHDPAMTVNAGDYAVTATVTDPLYSGSANGTLVIEKAGQLIGFGNPGNQVTTATVPLSATGGASNNPVLFTVEGPAQIDGSNVMTFTAPGSVTVRANQAGNGNYHAAPEVAHTFEVTAEEATLTLSRLHQVADGTPRVVVLTTDPADLDIEVTYDGETDPPTVPGTYAVVASATDPRYEGSANGTLVVEDPARSVIVPGGTLPALSTLGELVVPTFRIGAYEVTGSQWATVVAWAEANAGYAFNGAGSAASGDRPVTGVSWSDAAKWCNARTEWENALLGRSLAPAYQLGGVTYKTGTPASPGDLSCDFGTSGYRLPTAAEWEYAARGGAAGTPSTYPGGNTLDDLGWHAGNSDGAVQPAGGKNANGLNLYDLAGNAAEWTQDGPSGNPMLRYLRGGAWSSAASACELSALTGETAAPGLDRSGLRIARSVSLALTTALDHPDLTWESGGDAPWFAQTGMIHDGVDAAESGSLSQGQTSWMETSVEGPGNLRFRWKTEGAEGVDLLSFSVDASPLHTRSGTGDWEERLVEIGEGTHTLRWGHSQGSPSGPARAWVDAVAYGSATAPSVTTSAPADLTGTGATLGGEVTGDGRRTVTVRGVVYGTAPDPTLANGTDLPAATGGVGAFTVPAAGLLEGTTYFARAYATNNLGTSYGQSVVFTTDTTVAFASGIGTVTDRPILAGDRQVFRFTLTEARMVNFSGTGAAGFDWELRNASNAVVASGNGNIALARLLLAGNYSLVLTNATATDATVSLNLDASVVAVSRPDVQVGPTALAAVGANRYTPVVQTSILTSRTALPVTGFARVGNDGTLPTVLRVFGTRGTTFFRATYFGRLGTNPNANVTAQMNAGTYATPSLANTTAPVTIRAAIVPNRALLVTRRRVGTRTGTTTRRMTFNAVIRATSVSGPVRTDSATIRVNTQ